MHVSDDERVAAHDDPPEPAAQSPRARLRGETDESTQSSRLVLARCAAHRLSAGSRLCRPLRAARQAARARAGTVRTSVNNVRSVLRAIHEQDVSLGARWPGCRGIRFDALEDAPVLLAAGAAHSQRPPGSPVARYRPGFVHQPIAERPFDWDSDRAQAGAGCARLGPIYLMAGSGSASCCRTRRWACPSNRPSAERASSWGRTRSRR